MTCADFESLLDEQFGPEQLCDHPDLLEHSATCISCRAIWDRYRLLAEGIHAWRGQIPEVDLTAAILAHPELTTSITDARSEDVVAGSVRAANRPIVVSQSRSPVRSYRALVAGIAALSAVVAVVSVVTSPRDAVQPAGVAVLEQGTSGHESEPLLDDNSPGAAPSVEDIAESRAPYAGLAELAAGAWNEVSLLFGPASEMARRPSEPSDESQRDWIEDLQHQLKPIGRGLEHAFDFLWQAGESGDG